MDAKEVQCKCCILDKNFAGDGYEGLGEVRSTNLKVGSWYEYHIEMSRSEIVKYLGLYGGHFFIVHRIYGPRDNPEAYYKIRAISEDGTIHFIRSFKVLSSAHEFCKELE